MENTASIEEITAAKAEAWIEGCNFSIQRPLVMNHVRTLAKVMQRGKFGMSNIVFVKCLEDGDVYNVDGQHTLHAIAESGITHHLPVMRYTASTVSDVALLYTRIDIGKKRSARDAVAALTKGDGYDLLEAIPESYRGKLYTAAAVIALDFKADHMNARLNRMGFTRQDITEYMLEWVVPMSKLLSMKFTAEGRRRIFRKQVLPIALVTIKADYELAGEFWQGVATGEMLTTTSPAYSAIRYMESAFSRSATGARVHDEVIIKQIAHRWNLHVEGREAGKGTRPPKKPIKIALTEYEI